MLMAEPVNVFARFFGILQNIEPLGLYSFRGLIEFLWLEWVETSFSDLEIVETEDLTQYELRTESSLCSCS